MNDKINDGGPAFPVRDEDSAGGYWQHYGMTLKQYAAIRLRVPCSGVEWLDAAIMDSRKLDVSDNAEAASKSIVALAELASKKPTAAPVPKWPALPEGVPSVPEGTTFIGRGGEFAPDGEFMGAVAFFSGDTEWGLVNTCKGDADVLCYACLNADLHKITPKGGAV